MRQCDSRLKLLRTAHELIYRQSYGSVGVDQICGQSGVKKGSFYHFFRSKSDLTVAAYQYHWDQMRVRWEAIFGSKLAPLQKIDVYLDFVLELQRERLEKYGRLLGCPFVSLGSELSTQNEQIRRMTQGICDQRCAYLAKTLSDAMAAGEVSTADPEQLAYELHSYVMGLVQQAKIANDPRMLDRLRPGVYRMLRAPQSVPA
jgi:TetR/AcrR family transcriptional regulator, transcriptional repressor for nem operon